MGKRGRAPTPLAILKLEGSSVLRKKHIRGRKEIDSPQGAPAMPDLPPVAAAIWGALIVTLQATPGLLCRIDGPQLERYCRFFIRWRRIENEIDERITQAGGSVFAMLAKNELRAAIRGLQAESRRLDQALKEIEARFGMTPSDRVRLSVPTGPAGADGIGAFARKRG
jgi:phage terminase small subunit